MEYFASFLFISILFVIICVHFKNYKRDVTLVKSTLDNQKYFVRNLPDRVEAANRLAFIRQKLAQVVDYIKSQTPKQLYKMYVKGDKMETQMSITEFSSCIRQLIAKFRNKSEIFSENTPDSKFTSLSVNKGEELIFCLRLKKEGDKLVPRNTILFVALHELSHLMTKTIGHGEDFWRNFRFILKVAIKQNIYKPIDFNSNPQPYCGIQITDSPY